MSWNPDYATLAELKAQLRIGDTADDAALAVVITAASRAIDHECNRQFGSASATTYYTYEDVLIERRRAVPIDDLTSTMGLTVTLDTTGLGSYTQVMVNGTDFDLYPWNAALNGVPYTHLVLRPRAVWFWPYWTKGVQVAATFGWSAIPAVVHQACLIQAARLFVRRDSAYGVAGDPTMGSQVRLLARLDPDVALLLQTVKRQWGAA